MRGGTAEPPGRRVPRVSREQQRCGRRGGGDGGTRRNRAGGGTGPGSRPAAGPHSAERALRKGPVLHKAAAASPRLPILSPSSHSMPPASHPIHPPSSHSASPGCHSTPLPAIPPPSSHFIPPSSHFISPLPIHPPAPRSPSSGSGAQAGAGARPATPCAVTARSVSSPRARACAEPGLSMAPRGRAPEPPCTPVPPAPSSPHRAGGGSSWQCPSCRAAPRGFGEPFPRPSHRQPLAPVSGLSIANLRC